MPAWYTLYWCFRQFYIFESAVFCAAVRSAAAFHQRIELEGTGLMRASLFFRNRRKANAKQIRKWPILPFKQVLRRLVRPVNYLLRRPLKELLPRPLRPVQPLWTRQRLLHLLAILFLLAMVWITFNPVVHAEPTNHTAATVDASCTSTSFSSDGNPAVTRCSARNCSQIVHARMFSSANDL